MPITPFHLGPGMAVKAVLGDQFSLGVFALTQGVIDLESIANIVRGHWPIHAWLHTVVGATGVAVVCAGLGRAPCTRVNARVARRLAREPGVPPWLPGAFGAVTPTAAATGAVVGGLSHVALDAVMHPDVAPLAPWSAANPLWAPDHLAALHLGCVAAGVAGLVVWALRAACGDRRDRDGEPGCALRSARGWGRHPRGRADVTRAERSASVPGADGMNAEPTPYVSGPTRTAAEVQPHREVRDVVRGRRWYDRWAMRGPPTTPAELLARYAAGERDFCGLDLETADLRGVGLAGADFTGAWLRDADFRAANLRGTRFCDANVKCADFRGADLRDTDFAGASVEASRYEGANLEGTRFAGAHCYGYTLQEGEGPPF